MMLIIGAIAGMITMSLHPTGMHGIVTQHDGEMLALLTRLVHGLGMASLPLMFLGAMALNRRLANTGSLPLAAMVIYGFALVAIMIAAGMSGFVAPVLLGKVVAGAPFVDTWRLLIEYTFRINQAFASVFAVASCVAIILWSLVMVKTRQLSGGLGVYGLILGCAILVALLSGNLPLNVHGFGLVTFSQAIWFITTGVLLVRSGDERNTPEPAAPMTGLMVNPREIGKGMT